ncbi:hypothetical protein NC652_009203 [Populus alba x Populus x berolinensis]|nr:hypothetical protein NC652_009203 [Populus alba x Populus x berolinensis]
MGCTSSKRIEANVDVYRPPPSSFAVFDINSIQEPWLVVDNSAPEKTSSVPAPILEKLNKFETDAPRSWDEVSKALQDLKPTLNSKTPIATPSPPQKPDTTPAQVAKTNQEKKQEPIRKSVSFHTLEELEAKIAPKPEKELKKTESSRTLSRKVEVVNKTESRVGTEPVTEPSGGGVIRSVKENIFIVRDRLEREKEGKPLKKLDPLSGFEEKCPPGGADSVVLYTTSLRGIRRTGSCKVLIDGAKERCGKCNENGLVRCPTCL